LASTSASWVRSAAAFDMAADLSGVREFDGVFYRV
jgi:hypothetical protein